MRVNSVARERLQIMIDNLIGWSLTTHYVTFYMADGSVETYDLADWHTPLPRWRSLVVVK